MELRGTTPSGAITVVGEDRTVGSAGARGFVDRFEPYEVHIYRFRSQVAGLRSQVVASRPATCDLRLETCD
jgi:hypothetical protein